MPRQRRTVNNGLHMYSCSINQKLTGKSIEHTTNWRNKRLQSKRDEKLYKRRETKKKTTHTHTHTHMEETLKHQNNNNHNYKQQDARIRELLLYRCGIFIHIAFAANLLTCVCWTDIEWRMHVYAMHSYQRKPYVMCTLAIVRCLFRISPHSQVLDILLEQRILQCIAAYLCALHGFKSPQMQRIYQVQRHTCTTFFSMDWLFVYV